MYLMQGDYACAVQSLEQGQGLASSCTGCHLETISLVSHFWVILLWYMLTLAIR